MESKLLFFSEKKIRGASVKLFANGTIVLRSKTSRYGMNIPKRLCVWKKLPERKEDENQLILADFGYRDSFRSEKDGFFLKNITCEIYNNNFSCFIRPLQEEQQGEKTVRQYMRNNKKLTCIIPGSRNNLEQIPSTTYCLQATKLRLENSLPEQISQLEFITEGGKGKTVFSIHRDKQNKIFIKAMGILGKYGELCLSDELGRNIKNWFETEELCLCKEGRKEASIIPSRIRIREQAKTPISKELNFPYYGAKKTIEVIFTNPDFKLTDNCLEDYRYKKRLVKKGFNIRTLKNNARFGNHHNSQMARKFERMLRTAFDSKRNATVFTELEISLENKSLNLVGRGYHCFDFAVIKEEAKEITLFLIELKSSFTSNNSYRSLDFELAKLNHFTKQIQKTVVPIVVINGNGLLYNRVSIEPFFEAVGVKLITKEALGRFQKKPVLLKKELEIFAEKLTKKTILDNDKRQKPKLIGSINANHKGKAFEREVRNMLERRGYIVKSNVLFEFLGRKLEVDLLAKRNGKQVLVSCKDKTKTREYWRLTNLVSEALSLIEFRKKILDYKFAELFVKVPTKFKKKMEQIFRDEQGEANTRVWII